MENTTEAAMPTAQTCVGGAGINRRYIYIGIAIAAAAGLYFGWSWFVAIGISSLILSILPCLVMCALGICAGRMDQKKSDSATTASPSAQDR